MWHKNLKRYRPTKHTCVALGFLTYNSVYTSHIDDMLHWFFPPLFWNYSLTMICPIQLLRPAKKPMAGPSSCKGQNKVGDNFKIGAQRVNVLVSSMW